MSDEPTVGELVRQVASLVRQVDDLVQQLRTDYVRKEVYDARRLSDIRRLELIEVKEAERDKNAADTRRQLLFIILTVALTAVLGLLLSLSNYLSAGGGG